MPHPLLRYVQKIFIILGHGYCLLWMLSISGNAPTHSLQPVRRGSHFFNYPTEYRHRHLHDALKIFFHTCLHRNRYGAERASEWVQHDAVLQKCEEFQLQWIGHATFLIQVNNLNILTDPVFGDLHSILYPRMTAPGIPPELLPPIDIVLISHNHRDHLDESSIQKLKAHDPLFLVPAGTAKWFSERGITRVVEHQWWQKTRVNSNNRAIDLTFVPARHWSGRNLTDLHSSLWGGWTLQTNDASLYFAGDTAFDAELFAAIATHLERRPLCALLPIGPCEPRALMCHSHMGPEEVPAACAILKPLSCVPMHWGTFRLGPDAFDAPIQRLRTAWERQLHTIGTCNLRPMKLGERFSIHSINS